jgi:hypothetical protein
MVQIMKAARVEKDKKDILLTEYCQLNELYRQRDTTTWVMATIFIPATVAILGFAARYCHTQSGPLAIASLGMFAIFRLLVERTRYYSRLNECRMKKIERKLKMEMHSLFDRVQKQIKKAKDKKEKKKIRERYQVYNLRSWQLLGVRCLLDLFMLVLAIAWSVLLWSWWSWVVIASGSIWFIFLQTKMIFALFDKKKDARRS